VSAESREPVILGAADGLVIVLGLMVGLAVAAQPPAAVWHSGLSAGVAELVGMTAALWLSDGDARFARALGCGVASLAACVVPALPYLLAAPGAALPLALVLVAAVAGVIAWLRPQHGWSALAQTYGVLLVAALVTGGVGLL
jgi:VIT1/CCC1 family predicted Fe2+/Mn2+ transporter